MLGKDLNINEFNSFFNYIYSYRLPIVLTLVLVG